MAKKPIFTKLFGRSPINPIQKHMEICEKCAQALHPYIEAMISGDQALMEERSQIIRAFEHEADEIKRQVRLNLPRSLFLPISRSNLLELLQLQDKIANTAKDIAGLIMGRQMQLPVAIQPLFIDYLDASVAAVSLAREAMDELNDLVTSGFSGQEIDFIEKILRELDGAEHKSDLIQVQIRAVLFALESEIPAVDVFFLYKIIDLVGSLSDQAETVGNRMMYLTVS